MARAQAAAQSEDIVKFSDQIFDGVPVELDDNEFERCSFTDVTFTYSGGDLKMSECNIVSFRMQFGGQLATGLFALYQLFGTEGMLQIIRGFTEPVEGQIELAPKG
jgi:hypothetical protein